jgi:hypothetical protein
VPLICGTSYVKWHLPSSTSVEHRGQTGKALIREHKAIYNFHKVLPVRLTVDRNQMLQECELLFEVLQEYSEGGRGGRVCLGVVKLNLAEYVDDGDRRASSAKTGIDSNEFDEEDGVMRRYLMQESKINSTLKLGIKMQQLDGDGNFSSPPLKSAMVFGGIAGVMAYDVGDNIGDNNGGSRPCTKKTTREVSELQDMYRRNLAASFLCGSDELPPDKLIEDLFAGGDGGTMAPPPPPPILRASFRRPLSQPASLRADEENIGEGATINESDSRRNVSSRFLTPETARRGRDVGSAATTKSEARDMGAPSPDNSRTGRSGGSPNLSMSSLTSERERESERERGRDRERERGREREASEYQQQQQQQQLFQNQADRDKRSRGARNVREASEFDLREDLCSWQIGS